MTPADEHTLARTRSAVSNVLVVAALLIALSGWILRERDRWASTRAPQGVGHALVFGLLALSVASYALRRSASSRSGVRFYRAHVLAASLAALAVPLGFAYGWLVRPRLDAVGPFWVAALALGVLAFPRGLPEGFRNDRGGPPP